MPLIVGMWLLHCIDQKAFFSYGTVPVHSRSPFSILFSEGCLPERRAQIQRREEFCISQRGEAIIDAGNRVCVLYHQRVHVTKITNKPKMAPFCHDYAAGARGFRRFNHAVLHKHFNLSPDELITLFCINCCLGYILSAYSLINSINCVSILRAFHVNTASTAPGSSLIPCLSTRRPRYLIDSLRISRLEGLHFRPACLMQENTPSSLSIWVYGPPALVSRSPRHQRNTL